MPDADRVLAASIGGTARGAVREQVPDKIAIARIRDTADGRTDLMRAEAALAIGGWLGAPHTADDLRAAYLLLAATGLDISDGPAFVAEVDAVRRRVEGPRHGTPTTG